MIVTNFNGDYLCCPPAEIRTLSPKTVSVFDIIESSSSESYVFCAEETRK